MITRRGKNPKSEIRNPKEIRISKKQLQKGLRFELVRVSDFLRILDFGFSSLCCAKKNSNHPARHDWSLIVGWQAIYFLAGALAAGLAPAAGAAAGAAPGAAAASP